MLRTLYRRIAAVLLVLLVFVGGICLAVALLLDRQAELELNQRLNHGLAGNLVAGDVLLDGGRVNEAALARIFATLSLINPSIEVYLLDLEGSIVTHSAAADTVRRDRVGVAPIRAFLDGAPLPVLGDDPLSSDRRTVFSVAPIMVEDRYEGYLYVVLASAARQSLVSQVATSSALRQGLLSLTLAVVVALLAGLLLFRSLTRPLRALTARMEGFRRSDFTRPPPVIEEPGGDEIAELERTFAAMADRIIQQVKRLKQTDELRRELVANVSHDLRTPLAALQGYLETLVLKNGSLDPEERQRFLTVATSQAARLGHLVEELFELARLESAEVRPSIEPFPLAELVQDVVHEFRIQAEQAGVALTARLPEDLPLVAADIALMQRVLQNLLSNAIRHTEAGGSVTVVVHPEQDRVVVRVEDTGCGIPPDELERVFDRFYQASTGGRTRPPAGGLGLAIVRRILELHGSAIEAASRVDKGTAFSFALPAVA